MNKPSLCIPRVFANISRERVKEALEDVGLGEIERVDMVLKKNSKGEEFKRVFVHFKRWSSSKEAKAARAAVLNGEMFQVTYDDPWFWKIGMSHAAKPERRVGGVKKTKTVKARLNVEKRARGGSPASAAVAVAVGESERADLRAMLEEQRRELIALRETLASMTAPRTPPSYEARSPTSPPPLVRRGGEVEFSGSEHIARELASEFDVEETC